MVKLLILALFSVLLAVPSYGQSRKSLESKRKHLNNEIKLTTKMLNETRENTRSAYDQYITLQSQIIHREELIKTINKEIDYLDKSIERSGEVIDALEQDITKIKDDYSRMMRQAYRYKLTNNRLLYLFSAHNLSEAFLRWRYLRQYDDYRKKQAQLIIETQTSLASKISKNEKSLVEKAELIRAETEQQVLLNQELADKNNLVKNLKRESSKLSKQLDKQKQQRADLRKRIEALIDADIAARTNRKPTNSSSKAATPAPLSQESFTLATEFRKNKGKLPWPVASGFISGHFGEQPHPLNKQIKIRNTGIDIRTQENTEVKAVFKGEVVSVLYDPALNNAIMVKHGNYYTVYSNIKKVFVEKGDKVDTQQAIGLVDTKNGTSEIHFEVWKERKYQNPKYWIARR
ncbi:MAG: peptidoglycan DD-metalloendopeptidase family protein [Bacteroidota bacterium]